MGYKVIINEYSPVLNSTKVQVSEYSEIGNTTKVIVVEDSNIGISQYNAAIQAAADAKVSADAAAQSAANAAAALGTKVSKTGDTMTGNLTVPKVLLSASQGSEINAVVRKDHLDTKLALKADKSYTDSQLTLKLNLTGGTLSGNLTTTGILRGQLYHDKGYFNFGTYGSMYGDGRLQGYFREYNNGTPGAGYLGLNLEHRDAAGLATGNQIDIYLNGKFVYHEGRKPTASDVGALALTGGTLSGSLTTPKVLLSGNQGTEPNSVTSKVYVDTELSKKVDIVDNYKKILTSSENITFDLSSGVSFFSGVLTATNTTVNIINVDNKPNNYQSFSFSLKQGTGANFVSWPSNIFWSFGRNPVLTFTQGKIDIFQLITYDNGLTWFGSLIIAGA